AGGGRRVLYMCARRGEGDDLGVNAGGAQDLGAVGDVAVAAHGDVVVAGIVEAGVAFRVMRPVGCGGSLFDGFDVLRWIVMVMEVDDRHPCASLVLKNLNVGDVALLRLFTALPFAGRRGDKTRQSTREAPAESSPGPARCRAAR